MLRTRSVLIAAGLATLWAGTARAQEVELPDISQVIIPGQITSGEGPRSDSGSTGARNSLCPV